MTECIKTRASYSWSGNRENNELGFMEGDVITILQIIDETRYYGQSQRTNLKGYFPSKYVLYKQSSNTRENLSLTTSQPSTPTKSTISSTPSTPIKFNSSLSLFTLKKKNKSSSSTLNTDYNLSLVSNSTPATDFKEYTSNNNNTNTNNNAYDNYNNNSNDDKNVEDSSKKFKTSYVQQLLDSTSSTNTGTSSTFGHSDFSATSAGSFIRHKQENQDLDNSIYINKDSTLINKSLNDIIEKNELKNESKNKSKLFKNLLGSNNKEVSTTFDQMLQLSVAEKKNFDNLNSTSFGISKSCSLNSLSIKNNQENDLQRTKTITGHERGQRSKRTLMEQPDLILKPFDSITDLNFSARSDLSINRKFNYSIDSIDYDKVDNYILKLVHDPFLSPETLVTGKFLKKFKNELEILRAIYIYLATKFTIINKLNEKMSSKKMFEYYKIPEIMHKCQCTSHQLTWLFYIMADAANFKVELILGYLKYPFELNETITDSKKKMIINHSWISLEIENEFRFIDISLGNLTNNLFKANSNIWDINHNLKFYFLSKPFDIFYTHTPRYIDQQFILPPIDIIVQLSLPPIYSHGISSNIKFHSYNSSIFYLNDYEIYDFELEIPKDFIVEGKFKPFDNSFENKNSFVQYYFKNDLRIAHFQGIMSQNCPAGFIFITGRNHYNKKSNLLLSIPCFHKGKWKDLEWVKNIPGLSDVDIYLKNPKNYNLTKGKNLFDIRINCKTEWVEKIKKIFNGNLKIGLFSPNMKLIELNIENKRFKKFIDLNAVGVWKLGVIDVKHLHWKIIAEWQVL